LLKFNALNQQKIRSGVVQGWRAAGIKMKQRVERWVGVKVDDGDLVVDGVPARFALRIALRVLAFADIANVVAHVMLCATGLLPYPLGPAVIVGLVITTVIAGPAMW
jgi:hypothetical protein